MIKNLIKLADHLDKKGLFKEADYVDWIISKLNKTASSQEAVLGSLSDLSGGVIKPSKFNILIDNETGTGSRGVWLWREHIC